MDKTVRNATELAKALNKLQVSSNNHDSIERSNNAPLEPTTDASYSHNTATSNRSAAYNLSSSGLLTNLTATCQQTNSKLDLVADQLSRLTSALDTVVKNQERQLEVLAAISRHTLGSSNGSRPETPVRGSRTSALQQTGIKEFGYSTTIDLVSDMVARLVGMVELQVSARGKRYRSTRDMTPTILQTAVAVACKATFRKNGQTFGALNMPTAKSLAALTVAKRIGITNGIRPALNPIAFKQIMDDSDCRTMTTLLGDVVSRLCSIRWMIPYYEADILASLDYPYIDQESQILCTWSKLQDRPETTEESRVMDAQSTKRKRIGELLASGCSIKSAINSVLTT